MGPRAVLGFGEEIYLLLLLRNNSLGIPDISAFFKNMSRNF
jgi:hypothetical protein